MFERARRNTRDPTEKFTSRLRKIRFWYFTGQSLSSIEIFVLIEVIVFTSSLTEHDQIYDQHILKFGHAKVAIPKKGNSNTKTLRNGSSINPEIGKQWIWSGKTAILSFVLLLYVL